MKVLHLLKSEPDETANGVIDVHKAKYDVKVIDLANGDFSYESLVEDIFNYDRVISW
ncbi:MAG: hypothetical protein M1147_05260 [Nitrospirae bacterium]|nr:hypothetical protein [Nitrospirota bacterium]MCL5977526.1 hypothetical protein [Nitrospirota bacterium]